MNKYRLTDGSLLLDGRTVEAHKFKEFLDGLGGAKNILKIGDESIDYISRLFADYSKGIEIMDSLDRSCTDSEMKECVAEIRALYNKEFGAWTYEFLDKATRIGYDGAIETLATLSPVVAVVEGIDKSIDIFGEVTGDGAKAKCTYDAFRYYNIESDTQAAYRNALNAFNNASPDSENYSSLAEDLRNCFNLEKETLIKMYESMAGASSGDKKSYYLYCMRNTENLTMKWNGDQNNLLSRPDLLSFDEYMNAYSPGN